MSSKFSLLLHHESSLYASIDGKPIQIESQSDCSDSLLTRFEDIEKVYPFGE